MPFVRISLHNGLDDDTQNQISFAVRQALIQHFHVPKDDYFHVIERLDKGQMKYPDSYLGIFHSDNIVFIQIFAGSGRTEEQKEGLCAKIVDAISSSTVIKINDIIIILVENGTYHNWSFGNGKIQKPPHCINKEVECGGSHKTRIEN